MRRTAYLCSRFIISSLLLAGLISCLVIASASSSPSIVYNKVKSAGVWMNVVTVNMNDSRVVVTPAISHNGIGTTESFRSIMRRTQPAAAINGTFFCTRTLVPTGDIAIDGQLVYRGYLGTAVGIRYNNEICFLPSNRRDLYNWADYTSVLVAGPTLIRNGAKLVIPRDQGFTSSVHYTPRIRSAVGLTKYNKLLLITTTRSVRLSRLAWAMLRLKCVEAAVLDGGSSTGLYCRGKLIRNPARGMTNCLLVYGDLDSYLTHRRAVYPAARYSSMPDSGS